jgi:hypothetical protein
VPLTLRRIVDIVAITAACGLLAAVGWQGYAHFEHRRDVKKLSNDLRRFQQVLAFQSASGQTQTNTRGWPRTMDPSWFGAEPPRNPFLSADRPWVEVAPPEHALFRHPPVPMALDRSFAAFWYNPHQGIIRARVPMQISDTRTLELYNTVNSASLSSIHGEGLPPLPQPAAEAEEAQTAAAPLDDDR